MNEDGRSGWALKKSLSQLEGDWGSAPSAAPAFVKRIYELRDMPIEKLTPMDIRVIINQDVGLKYLLPIAFDILDKNLLLESEHYNGDLFAAVLRVKQGEYRNDPAFIAHVRLLIARYPRDILLLDEIDAKYAAGAIDEAIVANGWLES